MELPSIKLNIFKKLEYFLILKKFNRQFDEQFLILKKRKMKPDGNYDGVYPLWEIEKKILFWSYAFHKYLNHEIKDHHLYEMFISPEETVLAGGINTIFGNLEMRGFGKCSRNPDGKKEYKISKNGLAFGELLWYLYDIKIKKVNSNKKTYFNVFRTNYVLNRKSLGWIILQIQLICHNLFIILAVTFLTLEILEKIGLLDSLKQLALNLKMFSSLNIILLLSMPLILFTISLILDLLYKMTKVDQKFKSIEDIRKQI